MTTKKLLKTLLKKGGCTLGLNAKNGYMVSLKDYETKCDLNILNIKKTFKTYKWLHKQLKKHYQNIYIGVWYYQAKIYFDISQHIQNKHQAKKQGKKNNQISIYNIENDSYIYIKY